MPQQLPTDKQRKTVSVWRRPRYWLLGTATLLVAVLVAAAFLAEYLLTLPAVRAKIRDAIARETGAAVEYRDLTLSFLPSPAIEVRQLKLSSPEGLQGTAQRLRFTPDVEGILAGKLRLGTVDLAHPDLAVKLPDVANGGEHPHFPPLVRGGEGVRFKLPDLAGMPVAGVQLRIRDGRFSVISGKKTLAGERLNLDLRLAADDPQAIRASVSGSLARLQFGETGREQILQGLNLTSVADLANGKMDCRLDQLSLTDPGLTLTGSFQWQPLAASLHLDGSNIDVDATRRKILALAGDITPIKEIFSYLTGGTVPHISFDAQAKSVSALGDWPNLRLEGELQKGGVSIPEIALDLTEVAGKVTLADGILSGRELSARLGDSSGSGGTLAIGLKEGSDLFKLDLSLDADLAQAQTLLARLVEDKPFQRELGQFSQVKGRGRGQLVLGDSFDDLGVRIEGADVSLSFLHRLVSMPVTITSSKLDLDQGKLTISGAEGMLGQSAFSGLGCAVNWEKDPLLEVQARDSVLVLDELYPWLAGLKNLRPYLQQVTALRGRVQLGSARFKGELNQPDSWQYGAAGTLKGVVVDTPAFPDEIQLSKGGFNLEGSVLSLEKIRVRSLDGDIGLSGKVTNWQKLNLTLDGAPGDKVVGWLEERLSVPERYRLRNSITLSGATLSWSRDQGTLFAGKLDVADGPELVLDVEQSPRQGVKVHRLTVKDGESQAELSYEPGTEGTDISFKGTFRYDTLGRVFIGPMVGRGRVDGDLTVTIPEPSETAILANGHFNGTDMGIPLGDSDDLGIGQLKISAKGSQVLAEAGSLAWHGYLFDPVKAVASFGPDRVDGQVEEAKLCGIDGSGKIGWRGNRLSFDAVLGAKGLDVATSYTCLTQGRVKMSGSMDVSSRIRAEAEPDKLLGALTGPLKVTFRNGEIRKGRLMSTILEVLNVTEIVKGRLPNLASDGFVYSLIEIEGRFGEGRLHIDKLLMDGDTLDLVGSGNIDLKARTVKLELLAAPLKTVDTVIKYIPGVNYLLGGSLIAIPLSVKGTLDDPKVVVMSPSSVSKSLLNLGARTIKLPFKLIESLIPGGSE